MFRSKKDSGAPLEYRVTSRSAAQGVPCHAEQEECEAHIPQMETELEEILHEFVERILVHERSEVRKKKGLGLFLF